MPCNYEGCDIQATYCIEWWSLNQYGENPFVEHELYACQNPEHLVELSKGDSFGGPPDEIYREDTGIPNQLLLSLVKKAIKGELENIENIILKADPPKEQLDLFRN